MTAADELSAHVIRAELTRLGARPWSSLEVVTQCDSTNDLALERLRQTDGDRFAITAEMQRQGRGQRGASWRTPAGQAIALSIGRGFDRPLSAMGGLSLACGASVAQSLQALGARDVRVKWPNDLLVGQGKLGGILVETLQRGDRTSVAIGIGLNMLAPTTLARELGRPVMDLARLMPETPSRNVVIARLLADIDRAFEAFERGGFSALRADWLALHAWHGRVVVALLPSGEVVQGDAIDVAADGALVLATTNGTRALHSAEISLVTQ